MNTDVEMNEKRHRLQFEFSADAYDRLKKMLKKSDSRTFAELVRNALRLYEWYLEQQDQGIELALVKDDKIIKQVKIVL